MTRRYLTPKAKTALWQQQDGRCAECREPAVLGKIQWDHVLPLCLGGTNGENWQGLCLTCHATKTRREAAMRAKADRQRKFHEGLKKRRGPKLVGRGWDKRLRRRFDGAVEVRT